MSARKSFTKGALLMYLYNKIYISSTVNLDKIVYDLTDENYDSKRDELILRIRRECAGKITDSMKDLPDLLKALGEVSP